jgi:hypothetical protein
MTPQAWARGPDCLIVQPCSSAYRRASRMCLFGWSAIGVSALLAAGVCGTAIIPCWHDPASESIAAEAEDAEGVCEPVEAVILPEAAAPDCSCGCQSLWSGVTSSNARV